MLTQVFLLVTIESESEWLDIVDIVILLFPSDMTGLPDECNIFHKHHSKYFPKSKLTNNFYRNVFVANTCQDVPLMITIK